MSGKPVVIVGGGFAGVSAARTLMKRGITPLLLEAEDRAGAEMAVLRAVEPHFEDGAIYHPLRPTARPSKPSPKGFRKPPAIDRLAL